MYKNIIMLGLVGLIIILLIQGHNKTKPVIIKTTRIRILDSTRTILVNDIKKEDSLRAKISYLAKQNSYLLKKPKEYFYDKPKSIDSLVDMAQKQDTLIVRDSLAISQRDSLIKNQEELNKHLKDAFDGLSHKYDSLSTVPKGNIKFFFSGIALGYVLGKAL